MSDTNARPSGDDSRSARFLPAPQSESCCDPRSRAALRQSRRGAHLIQLYTEEPALLGAASEFAAAGLEAGEAVIVVSSLARWQNVQRGLQERGHDVTHSVLHGHLRFFALRHAFASAWQGDDKVSLDAQLGAAVRLALIRHRAVRVFNDSTDFLRNRRISAAARRLESALQHFAAGQPVSFLCAGRIDSLQADTYGGALQSVCASHTHLLPERDWAWLDEAVARALAEVLDPRLVAQASSLALAHRQPVDMPCAYHTMLWLKQEMPRTVDKVLARLRLQAAA